LRMNLSQRVPRQPQHDREHHERPCFGGVPDQPDERNLET